MPPNGFSGFSIHLTRFLAVLTSFLFLIYVFLAPEAATPDRCLPTQTWSTEHNNPSTSQTELTLRHIIHHGSGKPGPRVRRLDITGDRVVHAAAKGSFGPFKLRTEPIPIDRPAIQPRNLQTPISPLWISSDVPGPNVSDKATVLTLAYMSEDAYKPDATDPEWLDVGSKYNHSIPFGWEDSGIRGQVFSDASNSTVIVSVKGTTVAMFEGNGTSGHDKENDNLFGSCCCGQGGAYLWRTVCDCQTGTYTCDHKCVTQELRRPNRYYEATLELFDEVLQLYPNANIMTTGHSLGGVLASLMGLQHGIPSVSFEAYPQALAASRLGLPVTGSMTPLRKNTGGFHFGHTGDPVYMGTCNGASSFCSIAGYAFETLCHTGKRCVYDVVKDLGWRQSTSYHRLRYSIENVYEKYADVAECVDEDVDCVDCFNWKFENGTKTTTTSTVMTMTSTATSRTRTETCKTPGWWGCRDETTTSAPSTTSEVTTTTTNTNTCKTPGWFGCKDKMTTESTITSEESTTTTTCTTKGWFGRCLDATTTTITTTEEGSETTPATEAEAYWRTLSTVTLTATAAPSLTVAPTPMRTTW
ncbi:alpha/beta-hydrolase [Sporormia fimetaria CBS 119925]|uniref:triacylglycerol lipase n=1 Tax=Sporormia fimetaria CBS 119925 TaxID=1340428 RepID=A0A6A6VD55_9PLEO|nr:alpha/beta-hydrolase [Sporormia fimetaria CBS 119925]